MAKCCVVQRSSYIHSTWIFYVNKGFCTINTINLSRRCLHPMCRFICHQKIFNSELYTYSCLVFARLGSVRGLSILQKQRLGTIWQTKIVKNMLKDKEKCIIYCVTTRTKQINSEQNGKMLNMERDQMFFIEAISGKKLQRIDVCSMY